MSPEEKAIVEDIIAKAWDDGFEHCRAAATLLCTTQGRVDLATAIARIPLRVPAAVDPHGDSNTGTPPTRARIPDA